MSLFETYGESFCAAKTPLPRGNRWDRHVDGEKNQSDRTDHLYFARADEIRKYKKYLKYFRIFVDNKRMDIGQDVCPYYFLMRKIASVKSVFSSFENRQSGRDVQCPFSYYPCPSRTRRSESDRFAERTNTRSKRSARGRFGTPADGDGTPKAVCTYSGDLTGRRAGKSFSVGGPRGVLPAVSDGTKSAGSVRRTKRRR